MKHSPAGTAAALLAALAIGSPAAAAPRLLKVVDETNRGVASTILKNDGGDNVWGHLVYTGEDGSTTVDLECRSGLRFKAQPADSGRYWDSPPQDCAQDKPLRVISKPGRHASAEGVSVQLLNLIDGRSWYLVMQPVLSVEREEGRGNGAQGATCRINVSAQFERAVYEETASGAWRPVNLAVEAPQAVRPWDSPPLSSVVARTGCSGAEGEVRLARDAARVRLAGATDVAASWQTYGIAKTNPVESVELFIIPR